MKQTVFKKVMVADRLPSVSGRYFTSFGECIFSLQFNKWSFTIKDCTSYVDWWLEKIEQDDPEELKRQLTTKKNHLSYMMKNMVIWDKKENKVIDLLKHYKECVDSHTASQKEFSKMIDELLEELG